jgi:hypothetical protein
MSKRSSIFAVFSVLIGLLLFAIWSNIYVYAQRQSSPPPPPASLDPDSLNTTKISAQLKAKMCDPSNSGLKVVNTTEARICGIPKTVKNTTAATPPTSSVSLSPPQQTTTIKPTSVASVATPHSPKQQQITNTTNNNNTSSRTTEGSIGSKIAPDNRVTNSSLSSSSPSPIAPQVKAVNQPQQQHQTPITRINSTTAVNNTTAGQNYTFTSSTPPLVSSDKIMYLGYHGSKSNPTNHDSTSIDKSVDSANPNPKPSSHSIGSTSGTADSGTADSVSTDKKDKKQNSRSATKLDTPPTINSDDSNPVLKTRHHVRSSTSGTADSGSTTRKTSGISTDKTNSDSSSIDKTIAYPRSSTHHIKDTTSSDNGFADETTAAKSDNIPTINSDSSSTDMSTPTTKLSGHHHTKHSTVTDNGSTEKKNKNTDTTKSDNIPTINSDSSSTDMSTPTTDNDSTGKRTAGSYATTDNSGSIDNDNSDPIFSTSINDGSILSSSDLASAIRNKVDSIIRNSMGGIIDNTPFLLPFH